MEANKLVSLFFYKKGELKMLKEIRTYVDYDGVERKETLYFNLTEAELVEMQYSIEGGFAETVQKIIDAKDERQLIKFFKDLLLKTYARKSADGRRLEKSPEISAEFSQTPMYSDMFIELVTDTDKASRFINGIIPQKLQETNPVPAPPVK